jgi:hypothetical protein
MNAITIVPQTRKQPAPSPNKSTPAVRPKKTKLPAGLFSERTGRIGSENAFRIGPQIRELEMQGHKVIKCDLKIGLERIRSAATDVEGFQEFIQEGKHLC